MTQPLACVEAQMGRHLMITSVQEGVFCGGDQQLLMEEGELAHRWSNTCDLAPHRSSYPPQGLFFSDSLAPPDSLNGKLHIIFSVKKSVKIYFKGKKLLHILIDVIHTCKKYRLWGLKKA